MIHKYLLEEIVMEKDYTRKELVSRFSRQIIVPGVGISGQYALKNASVLIVGVGGLGCPAAMYLCSAGIGEIGLIDYDDVEVSNLPRQILHPENNVGLSKVDSAENELKRMNRDCRITKYKTLINSKNALDIIVKYDVIIDASDNVPTRYLLNDACILSKRPLVSGSALQLEGQLIVYNYRNSCCYRCLFPQPPPPSTVNNCSDSGILGPVCGTIGVLQALQVIKIITDAEGVLYNTMLLFDAIETTFRRVKLRSKRANCEICGTSPKLSQLIDYEHFCQAPANDKGKQLNILKDDERIDVDELKRIIEKKLPHLLIDTRKHVEYEMCHIPNSVNIPLSQLDKVDGMNELIDRINTMKKAAPHIDVIFICRRGNDSQIATRMVKDIIEIETDVKDVRGGLNAWSEYIDPTFPIY